MNVPEMVERMEALLADVDDPLGREIREMTMQDGEAWPGHAFESVATTPRDKSDFPATGYLWRVIVFVEPITYTYGPEGSEPPR